MTSKKQAKVHEMSHSDKANDNWDAVKSLGYYFSEFPDTDQALGDLLHLANNSNPNIRKIVAEALGYAFQILSDNSKNRAYEGLHLLAQDENEIVLASVADAFLLAIPYLSDRNNASNDLHRLAEKENAIVLEHVADALGHVFPYLYDNYGALVDLHKLTLNKNKDVRMFAYHSLGMAYIFNATKSDNREAYRVALSVAISYFEKSFQERTWYNPADFCLKFYRALFAIIFSSTHEDLNKYRIDLKEIIVYSETRKELYIAVNNLAKALQRSQKLKDKSIDEIAEDIENLSKNYETALKHLSSVEDNAPNAVKIIQIGLPIIEEIIKAAIAGIKEKANHIDQMTSGTGTVIEQFVSEINRAAASLSHEDLQKMQECSMRIVDQMRHVCEQLSFEYCGLACQVLREADQENDPLENLFKIELALSYLSQNILRVVHDEQLKRVEKTLEDVRSTVNLCESNLSIIQQDQIDLINEVKSNVEKYPESLLNGNYSAIQLKPQFFAKIS